MTENRMTLYVLFCARYYVVVYHVTYINGLSNRVTSAFDFIIAYTCMYVNVKQKFTLILLYTTFQLLHHLPRTVVCIDIGPDLVPVPLSIFRSNSKFDENSERSSFKYTTRPITTIFCTRHDSDTVVTCAKYRCDRPRIFDTRVFWIFIEFRIRSKYA